MSKQEEAVHSRAQVLALCGGGGTGKTEILAEMVPVRLKRFRKVLILAYTNRAVLNMQERLSKKGISLEGRVRVCTFHSWAFGQLMNLDRLPLGYRGPLKLVPGLNSALVTDHAQKAGFNIKADEDFLNRIYAKHLRLGVSLGKIQLSRQQQQVLHSVNFYKRANNLLDFDDIPYLLSLACQLPFNVSNLARIFPCILVDEFQDITGAQWKTLKALIQQGTHFVGAGDPYQTLFRFAGASHKRFPQLLAMHGCESHMLTKNHRLTKEILSLSNEIRGQVRKQLPGLPFSPQSSDTSESKPVVAVHPKRHMHVRGILQKMQKHLADGMSLNDMVVLVRHDKDADLLLKKLRLEQWPFVSLLKKPTIPASVEMVQAVLKIHHGTGRAKEWTMVLDALPNIGDSTITKALVLLRGNEWTTAGLTDGGKRIREVFQKLRNLSEKITQAKDPSTAMKLVLDFVRPNFPTIETDPNIEVLFQNAKVAGTLGEITDLGKDFTCYENHGTPNPEKQYLTIANVHKYKGGEAEVVFFLAPYPRAYDKHGTFRKKKGILDEMMTLDTAITRSSKFLYLFFPMTIKAWKTSKPQKSPADFITAACPVFYDLRSVAEWERER